MSVRFALVLAAVCATSGGAFLMGSAPVNAANPCGINAEGHQATRLDDGSCADLTPPSPEEQKIITAKQKLARDYAAYKAGKESQAQVDKDWQEFEDLTGAGPFPAGRALNGGASVGPDGYVGLTSHQQTNYYYCGPAMVQNMLWFLGPLTSTSYDPYTGQYDSLTGNGSHDQPILANQNWLQTDMHPGDGTYWGAPSDTINRWMGWQVYLDQWYGGSSDKAGAASLLQMDTDYGWPDGENIRYFSGSYVPTGWPQTMDVLHWDTVYYFDGSTIGIAQSYPDPFSSGTWYPYYGQDWYYGWLAIYYGHGIVY